MVLSLGVGAALHQGRVRLGRQYDRGAVVLATAASNARWAGVCVSRFGETTTKACARIDPRFVSRSRHRSYRISSFLMVSPIYACILVSVGAQFGAV